MTNTRPAEPRYDGAPDFDRALLPELWALPHFRLATAEEIDRSYAAYCAADFAALCDLWCAIAAPTRATLGRLTFLYDRARFAPARANGLVFLATVRAVLRAGEALRAQLSPPARAALTTEFPWLERRHEHIPPGWTPPFHFPSLFGRFLEAGSLDDTRARWQLCCALNEVQQQHYSRHAAARFGVPALARHAARERELALNYFAHWAPPATRELWRQCLLVLDGLNAATFALLCQEAPAAFVGRAALGLATRGGEWRAFLADLERPQWLLPLD